MITRADVAIIVSLGATVAAVASAAFSYWTFRESTLPPEIFARLDRIEVQYEQETVIADVEFSVSNRSSREVTLIHCAFLTDRLHTGAGGYGTRPSPCMFNGAAFDETQPLVISPGQTHFFEVGYRQESNYDFGFFLDGMGIDIERLRQWTDDENCSASFGISHTSRGWSQSCGMFEDLEVGTQAFEMVLQSGTGETFSTPIRITSSPNWPWSYARN